LATSASLRLFGRMAGFHPTRPFRSPLGNRRFGSTAAVSVQSRLLFHPASEPSRDSRATLRTPAKDIAAQFGVDPSTFSLYLRLARFPDEILDRIKEPQRLAVLPARRVMEAIEADPATVQRNLNALDAHEQTMTDAGGKYDPAAQIDVMIRAAEGRGDRSGPRSPVPERRHIVHQGRRIGTLTRNGGQWVFRFATSIPDSEVQVLAERLAAPVNETRAGLPLQDTPSPEQESE
jgi:hypothetical protein